MDCINDYTHIFEYCIKIDKKKTWSFNITIVVMIPLNQSVQTEMQILGAYRSAQVIETQHDFICSVF